MSLDERIRSELRNALEAGQLREDQAFNTVWTKHRRDLVRSRVARQATAVAVVLSLFASAAIVLSWRNTPDRFLGSSDRFRSTATLRVARAPSARATPTTSRALNLPDP